MKLSLLIPQQLIVQPTPKADSIPDILENLLDQLLANSALGTESQTKEALLEALVNREKAQPTAIGEGVAFPHARILGLEGAYHLVGFSPEGLPFKSPDDTPVHVFFLSLTSRENPSALLRSRAAFTRSLAQLGGAEGLKKLGNVTAIWEAMDESDIRVDQEIMARDLMRPIGPSLQADMSLRDAARALHLHHTDTLPVVDEDGIFRGQLSCHELFSYGLPDFFKQLHTISFIRHMNPFEKYFQTDHSVTVIQAIEKNQHKNIPADATLMEVIFEMSVKNSEVLFVTTPTGKLLGLIDRYSIVDRILVSAVSKELP